MMWSSHETSSIIPCQPHLLHILKLPQRAPNLTLMRASSLVPATHYYLLPSYQENRFFNALHTLKIGPWQRSPSWGSHTTTYLNLDSFIVVRFLSLRLYCHLFCRLGAKTAQLLYQPYADDPFFHTPSSRTPSPLLFQPSDWNQEERTENLQEKNLQSTLNHKMFSDFTALRRIRRWKTLNTIVLSINPTVSLTVLTST